MTIRAWGAGYRTTTLCIDAYENGVPNGRIYNPYFTGGKTFRGVTQFLLEMEQLLDTMDFPRAFTATRTFVPAAGCGTAPPKKGIYTGGKATFALRILFRQNASWQGSVTWLEQQQEQSFRSVLELLLLIDNALSCQDTS